MSRLTEFANDAVEEVRTIAEDTLEEVRGTPRSIRASWQRGPFAMRYLLVATAVMGLATLASWGVALVYDPGRSPHAPFSDPIAPVFDLWARTPPPYAGFATLYIVIVLLYAVTVPSVLLIHGVLRLARRIRDGA